MQNGPDCDLVKFDLFQIWTKGEGRIRRPVAYMQRIQAAHKSVVIYPTDLWHVRRTAILNNPSNKPTLFEKSGDMSY